MFGKEKIPHFLRGEYDTILQIEVQKILDALISKSARIQIYYIKKTISTCTWKGKYGKLYDAKM